MTRRALLVLVALLPTVLANAVPVLDRDARAARDANRLAATKTDGQARQSLAARADRRRAEQTRRLRQAEAEVTQTLAEADRLAARAARSGDDLDQTAALVRTALSASAARIDGGPMVIDQSELAERSRTIGARAPDIDTLYEGWYALHDAWLAGAQITWQTARVTREDGQRRNTQVTRFGDLSLNASKQTVLVDPVGGLLVAPESVSPDQGLLAKVRRLIDDGGAVGIVILLCAVVGVITMARAWLGRRGTGRDMALITNAALLLGLLGTIVGLIHTFRGLSLRGGADVALAAAGISHALATTALALIVAISLTLMHPVVRRRVSEHRQQLKPVAPTRFALPGRPASMRLPPSFGAALALAVGLFVLMQWLTQRPLSELPPPERIALTRVELPPEPRPLRPPPQNAQRQIDPLAIAVPALTSAPTALPSLPAPAPRLSLPALTVPSLAGSLGSGAPVGGGRMWAAGTATGEFDGEDLIPITSVRPRYPAPALAAGVDGFVDLIFEIGPRGQVRNVRVLDAEPPGVFEQAAADAVARWLYAPYRVDGQAVAREATQRLVFDHQTASATWQDGR
ncbi:MAG: TonB family protein [Pseudomonadota bacterium]